MFWRFAENTFSLLKAHLGQTKRTEPYNNLFERCSWTERNRSWRTSVFSFRIERQRLCGHGNRVWKNVIERAQDEYQIARCNNNVRNSRQIFSVVFLGCYYTGVSARIYESVQTLSSKPTVASLENIRKRCRKFRSLANGRGINESMVARKYQAKQEKRKRRRYKRCNVSIVYMKL